MECPKCYVHMNDEDDLGDGDSGYECPICGYAVADYELPCPDSEDGSPCFKVDTEWGGYECGMCGRDM